MKASEKPHIGIFGRRNHGKSSLLNALAGQTVSIVSDTPGTTADSVRKHYEIVGLGPTVLIDTAGIDDTGSLGEKRVAAAVRSLRTVDMALYVIHGGFTAADRDWLERCRAQDLPFIIVHNMNDRLALSAERREQYRGFAPAAVCSVSAVTGNGIEGLVDEIRRALPETVWHRPTILGDLVGANDLVMLITPIDAEAPQGRLILPQVQTIRDCLDNNCITTVLKERELESYWKTVGVKPALAVTDSQVFLKAAAALPDDVPLTGFSLLFARLRGDFENYQRGTPAIDRLRRGDRVLIMESCSHHVSCDDIGRVKIPRWLTQFTGQDLRFTVLAGSEPVPEDIGDYRLVVQCGGCMHTRRQVLNRLRPAVEAGVPVTNYGMTIAYCLGIYDRAMAPFGRCSRGGADYL